MTSTASTPTLQYDPYDAEIDRDPYPTWARLRDEAPLYRNEEHGFWALSRWDDVKVDGHAEEVLAEVQNL